MDVQVEFYPDGTRLRVVMILTPFLENPSLELALSDNMGRVISHTYIIESPEEHLTITLHTRGYQFIKPAPLRINVFYPELGTVDEKEIFIDPLPRQ